jgi:hypothetical protein
VRVFTILGKLLDRSTRALQLHHEVSCNLHSSPAGQSYSGHTHVSCHALATSRHLYDSATKPSRRVNDKEHWAKTFLRSCHPRHKQTLKPGFDQPTAEVGIVDWCFEIRLVRAIIRMNKNNKTFFQYFSSIPFYHHIYITFYVGFLHTHIKGGVSKMKDVLSITFQIKCLAHWIRIGKLNSLK